MKLKQFIFASMAMLWSFVSPVLAQNVAKIGETPYETLEAAFAAATGGQTITMINDVELTEMVTIPEGKELTLDLNGKTVNSVLNNGSETNHIYALSNKGTLTIKDSSEGDGSINSRGIYNYGSLTLNAGAINAIDGNGGYAVNNKSGSTFVMNGGIVAATNEDDHQSSSGGYDATALNVPAGCTATLNGGTINNKCDFTYAIAAAGILNIPATSTIIVNGTHGAIAVSGGKTTINAGKFQIPADSYSRTDNVLYVSGGSLVVNGGTFIGDSDTASGGSCLYDKAGKAVVNGGTFKGSSGGDVWGTTGTTIKGGTFENLTEKNYIAEGYELGADGTVVAKYIAKIGETTYATLADALAATKTMTGDVTVEILDKVTFNQPLIGSYSSIHFVGKTENAEMYLDVQGYTTATGKEVSFTDLKLSKSVGGHVTNAGFMNVAFGIYDVKKVTYNNCTFLNGACASSGDVTFNGCTFYRSHDRYGLWAYGAPNVTVDGCTFADIRGIKLWDEGKQKLGALTVKNTNFSAVTDKPAIVLTSGKSVTLEDNTYNAAKGALELDLDGNPNGTPVISDVAPTCVNDNGACGVLVDGKIYTTVAQAKEVAIATSTVTLLHNSAETVEFPEGVTLDKNGFEALGVTVAESVELPEVVVTDIKNSLTENDPDLTFALNFAIKDVENLTDEYLEKLFAKYGDWYTDYVLTISGLTDDNVTFNANGGADGYLAGQYDAWSENWVSVPFEDVTIANGQGLYIMEYAAKLMGKQGLRFTLAEVAEIVQNFDCGVYFTPEFLAANPNMQVNLQLKVFTEDADGNKIGNIDVAEREFTAAELQENELVIVDGDGKDFVNAETYEVGKLTYKRRFAEGIWNPLFVPFEIPMSALSGYDVAYINDMHSYDKDNDGVIEEFGLEVIYIKDQDATLNASHPYVIRPKNAEACNMELVLNNATLYNSTDKTEVTCSSAYMNFAFNGTYSKIPVKEGDRYYVLAKDENGNATFGYAKPGATLNPFRFFFTMESRGGSYVKVDDAALKTIRIYVQGEGDTTGIVSAEFNTNAADQIFDLQGRRVANPVKGGIYIVNGKKVYINK